MPSSRPEKVIRFSLGVLLGMSVFVGEPAVRAEIRTSDRKGLSTKVNGRKGGRCDKGICKISGGKNSGKNKFLKFKQFDTRGKIKSVEFDTGKRKNLIIGVTSPLGSFIDKSIRLSSKANVHWLSPGGIQLGAGAGFINVPRLNLSTSRSLQFQGGAFDVFNSRASDLKALIGQPLPGSNGFSHDLSDLNSVTADGTVPGIQMDGIDVSIDRSLFADALGGAVEVRDSTIAVGGTDQPEARLTLTGDAVTIGEGSSLQAQHRDGGGLIEVGGSWQNTDETVRQATTAVVEAGAVLDASAGEEGDGGEIVVW
ncbi:MAG: filamentous hemagglutinin, partial [Synechococcus sp.]|nr:filamentous hemagglutinin [Synechococcus sp.]